MLCWQWYTCSKWLVLTVTTFKVRGVVMRHWLRPLARKFWWEYCPWAVPETLQKESPAFVLHPCFRNTKAVGIWLKKCMIFQAFATIQFWSAKMEGRKVWKRLSCDFNVHLARQREEGCISHTCSTMSDRFSKLQRLDSLSPLHSFHSPSSLLPPPLLPLSPFPTPPSPLFLSGSNRPSFPWHIKNIFLQLCWGNPCTHTNLQSVTRP